ncbi:MAG TPA: hypothetical protein VFQ30_20840 [Ktedonobacteraceae bacterium]|nr:hypothetical protein [Ktedonobacteraceae bacterium]
MHSPNIRMQAGPTIKQYGRFHLKRFEVYRDEREIPTNNYVVMLDDGDGNYEHLGLIESDKSTFPELLDYIHDWQHHEYNQIYRTKQLRAQTENAEARARYQHSLDFWELRYDQVDDAIRELEPD